MESVAARLGVTQRAGPTPEAPAKIHADHEDDEGEIDLKYIIANKPPTAIVREFYRQNILELGETESESDE